MLLKRLYKFGFIQVNHKSKGIQQVYGVTYIILALLVCHTKVKHVINICTDYMSIKKTAELEKLTIRNKLRVLFILLTNGYTVVSYFDINATHTTIWPHVK